jgi:DNA-binding SARP family transcriptional activator
MPFEAKVLVPSPCDLDAVSGAFEDVAGGTTTLLAAPSGYVLTEELASAFIRLNRQPLWLRVGLEDRDPATFLLSVVTAARRLHHDAGQATLRLMIEQPGPVFGWRPLFVQLAQDLRFYLAAGGALVLEDVHNTVSYPTLSMLGRHLLPELDGVAPCVLVAQSSPSPGVLNGSVRRASSEFRLTATAVKELLESWAPELTPRALDRAVAIVGGRAAVLAGLRDLNAATDGGLEPLLGHIANVKDLVARIAETLLIGVDGRARCALGLATRIEYAHPALISAVFGESQLPAGPWIQPLEDGWVRIRPCWRRPLGTVLGKRAMPDSGTLHQSADWLLEGDACEQAISLYLEISDLDCAARVIRDRASTLMDHGQWATLDAWLARLPKETFAAYPDLSCDRADIAAAKGDAKTAHRWYGFAASQYVKRNDAEGASRSMLADSAVAAEVGDLANAMSRANAASSLADAASSTTTQMWATWQQGRVALAAGDSDAALASFCRAASSAALVHDGAAAAPVTTTGDLAARVEELRRQAETHRERQAALKQAQHDALHQLLVTAKSPAVPSNEVFGSYGWSRAPAPLKLPGLAEPGAPEPNTRARPLNRPRRTLMPRWMSRRLVREDPESPAGQDGHGPGAPGSPLTVRPAGSPAAPGSPPAAPGSPPAAPGSPPTAQAGPPGAAAGATRTPRPAGAGARAGAGSRAHSLPELAVHLLGPLCAAVGGVAVQDWPSARCRSLFGYLLTHREPGPPREVLMEVFWPGSSPEASRNSLNVAIHGLRRTLRSITDRPIVVHAGGVYRINRDLRLWLDVEEFDSHVESGRRSGEAGDLDEAIRHYEFAASLYRGDFMADDPYEDWAALTRERLRLTHLDALGRLSKLYFNVGHYTVCASLCLRIIERDPCREDAHRRLMCCYSRQGLPHLALMQYRMCVQALTDELGVEADPATTELYQHIRSHEHV